MTISPVLIIILAALVGAALSSWVFQRHNGNMLFGMGVGALGGTIGSLIFMIPLNFCTFEVERTTADHVFGTFLIVSGMLIVLSPVNWIFSRRLSGQNLIASQGSQGTFKGFATPVILLTPTIGILLVFLYYPSLETLRLSTLLARLGARREVFVCVDNFTRLVDDQAYFDIVIRTLWISAAIVIIGLVLSLLIATMAYLPIKGASIYRTLLIWPYAISPAVAGIIFLLMFNPTGGIINHLTRQITGTALGWTNDPNVAPWTVIIASVWKSMGYNILFYIAGLQNVPKDLLEAAAIDGANVFQRFYNIVIPQLAPITFFLIVTNSTYAFFETYATIDYLTPGGGPLQSTTTMMYNVVQLGVGNNDLGKAAARSIILFLMVIGFTIVQFRSGGQRSSTAT
ncbi:MAG: sugar ABC transporter permease [Aggregatilineales bacterium]